MANTEGRDVVGRLRELQDELDAAKADPKRKRGHCGAEQLAVDTAAGDALADLLAVVEAAKDVVDNPKSGVPEIMATLRLGELRDALARLYDGSSGDG